MASEPVQDLTAPVPEQHTVTVTAHPGRRGPRYTLAFTQLPGRVFGPWDFAETVQDLTISALLPRREARDLVLDAAGKGSATAPVSR